MRNAHVWTQCFFGRGGSGRAGGGPGQGGYWALLYEGMMKLISRWSEMVDLNALESREKIRTGVGWVLESKAG